LLYRDLRFVLKSDRKSAYYYKNGKVTRKKTIVDGKGKGKKLVKWSTEGILSKWERTITKCKTGGLA
jgi:antitoxin component YwqK of YwqJK toxin-antitoxin module